jgi:hypothetical protein
VDGGGDHRRRAQADCFFPGRSTQVDGGDVALCEPWRFGNPREEGKGLSELNVAPVTVGGVVLVIGLHSILLRRSFVSTPLVALLAGVSIGPSIFGLLEPSR